MSHLRTNLHCLDGPAYRRAIEGLAAARGLPLTWGDRDDGCGDHEDVLKAGEEKDFFHGDPVLEELLRRASADFETWLRRVMEAVKDILGETPVLPLTDATRSKIREELRRRRNLMVYNWTGVFPDAPSQLEALKHLGLIEKWTHWPVEATLYGRAWARSGGATPASYSVWVRTAGGEPTGARPPGTPADGGVSVPATPSTARPMPGGRHQAGHQGGPAGDAGAGAGRRAAAASEIPLGPYERQAVEYARQSAGTYLTKIADDVGISVQEVILHRERQITAERIVASIETRRGFSGSVSDLFWDLKKLGINRDLHRVVRTEMQQAFHEGARAVIRERDPNGDPLVYKSIRPGACRDCKRIWLAEDGAPRLYRLSELESNGPNNYGRKREHWRATVGPTHPNCSDSAALPYSKGLTDLIFNKMRKEARP